MVKWKGVGWRLRVDQPFPFQKAKHIKEIESFAKQFNIYRQTAINFGVLQFSKDLYQTLDQLSLSIEKLLWETGLRLVIKGSLLGAFFML